MADSTKITRGPTGYENWKRALEGKASLNAYEVYLYSDAHLTGEIAEEAPRPYALLNAVPITASGVLAHTLTLRVQIHEESGQRDMEKTDFTRYHGGSLTDEITALLSLALGVRLRPGGVTRHFWGDDPKGRPSAEFNPPSLPSYHPKLQVVPRATVTNNINKGLDRLFDKYPCLAPENAVALVRAARLYQDSIWVAQAEPEIAWLFLVSAVEVLATLHQIETTSATDLVRKSIPKLAQTLTDVGGEPLLAKAAAHLHRLVRATGRFIDFVIEFMPGVPEDRPKKCFPISWDHESMKQALSKIYDYRSRALHDGTPFPKPMCESPWLTGYLEEAPSGLASHTQDATWTNKDLPMLLHTFEYIARGAILNWWRRLP